MERSTKRRRLRAPSPAMVVACIALAIALSGASYAAVTLPRNSVGTKQLKTGAVTNAKIHKNAVTGIKVKDSSLTGADIANNSLTGDDVNESTLSGVDAATLGGHGAGYFEVASTAANPQFDAYVASGSAWVDSNSAGRGPIILSRFNAPPAPSPTQTCSQPGPASLAAAGIAAAAQDVHLPNGAIISGMVVDYGDDANSGAANGTVTLTRMPLFSGSGDQQDVLLATLAAQTAGVPFTATDGLPPFNHPEYAVVDNSRYAYTLQAFPQTVSTTLSLASSAGATGVRVASTTNLAAGQNMTIDTAASGVQETRTIASISAAASPAPNVIFTSALTNAHASGVPAVASLGTIAYCNVKVDYQLP
jgi:hypothetical protein